MRVVHNFAVNSAIFRRGQAWSPNQLFDGGLQGAWYDPSDVASLFQDTAGTVPVTTDGDPVALIMDKSGNGNHAMQTDLSRRPTWRQGGGLSWLEFDGTDDRLRISAYTYAQSTLTICAGIEYGATDWGAIKSAADSARYTGWSHPTTDGATSFPAAPISVNGVPIADSRIALRNATLMPAVVTIEGVTASRFDGLDCRIVTYRTTTPPTSNFFGYIEVEGGGDVSQMQTWIAAKTGVSI